MPKNLDKKSALRLERHKAWCEAVLATVCKKASTEDICFAWSLAAEKLIAKAWELAGGTDKAFIILALGKLGSRELNLSSDIDLVLVRHDQNVIDDKIIKSFSSYLSEINEFAFCFRLDLNLRPGGASGSTIPSQTEFEYHYGYHGEMWERLSYVRARFIYGDSTLANEVMKFVNHFSYRKHIDLTLKDDLSHLRNKIHHEMSLKDQSIFNLKLSSGGIRDIELFVHSLQLIHGGKNKNLQTQSTSEAIHELEKMKFLSPQDARFLFNSYWYFRDIENHLQATQDRQTYSLSKKIENFAHFKMKDILQLAKEAEAFVSQLLKLNDEVSLPEDPIEQKTWLKAKGFSKISIDETWPTIISASALALKSEKAEVARLTFLQSFVEHLSRINRNKDLALALLSDFIHASRAKASLYSLLNREQKLTEEIAWLFSCSPYLANIFALRPELIDSLFFNAQADLPTAQDEALEMLIERRLLVEILCAQKFLKDGDLGSLFEELTNTADEICKIILERLVSELASEPVNMICLGKWGGRELGFRSDLDFIFVTKAAPDLLQQKLSKRFLHWLSQPMNRGGTIYNVDLRLRPSGQAGPLLVSEDQLCDFLEKRAAPWERQAYLRARALYKIPFVVAQIAAKNPLSKIELAELKEIRYKLLTHDPNEFDLKLSSGGLVDIEFQSQISLLERAQFSLDSSTHGMIQYNMAQDKVWKSFGPELLKNYNFLRSIEQMHQLTSSQSQTKLKKGTQSLVVLANNLNLSVDALEEKLKQIFSENSLMLAQLRGEK